jgi:hypothetical protein
MNKHNLNKDSIIDSLGYDDKTKEFIRKNLIFLTVSGSHAYGTNTEKSDMDIRGIFVGEKQNILGNDRIDQFENSTNDTVIYELRKALNLIAENNPNVSELLFVDEEDIIYATEEYWNIRKHNQKFISSLARQKYSGYAMSQLKRIHGHSKWIIREKNGEFDKKPEMIDYCRIVTEEGITSKKSQVIEFFSSNTFLTHETNTIFKIWVLPAPRKFSWLPINKRLTNLNGWFDNENCTFYFKENIESKNKVFNGLLFFAKDEFTNALDQYKKWKSWKENRNIDRHDLEEKYKMDTKHAAHLVRLLRMGYEILTEGKVLVKRPDAKELLDIRNGKWTYDELIAYAENMDNVVLEEAYKDFVNKILVETYEKFWGK